MAITIKRLAHLQCVHKILPNDIILALATKYKWNVFIDEANTLYDFSVHWFVRNHINTIKYPKHNKQRVVCFGVLFNDDTQNDSGLIFRGAPPFNHNFHATCVGDYGTIAPIHIDINAPGSMDTLDHIFTQLAVDTIEDNIIQEFTVSPTGSGCMRYDTRVTCATAVGGISVYHYMVNRV